jgi:hypothetical protein
MIAIPVRTPQDWYFHLFRNILEPGKAAISEWILTFFSWKLENFSKISRK